MSQSNASIFNSSQSLSSNAGATSVVLGLCCLVGIPANIAVVMGIIQGYKKANITLKLILSLAISDLLSLLAVPVSIYSLLHGWIFGRILCKLLFYMLNCCLCNSVLTVTLMSVQRYIQVQCSQYWERLRKKGARVLLIPMWILAFVLSSPNIPTRDVVKKRNLLRCQRCTNSDEEKVAILLLETLLGFIVPLSILATSYFCLHKKVNQTPFFKSNRMTKLVTRIVVAFFICWFPTHVINMVDVSTTLLKESQPDVYNKLKIFRRAGGDFAKALSITNSCLNPFLYFFALRKIHHISQKTDQKKDTQTTNT